jgi:hypothetical protein
MVAGNRRLAPGGCVFDRIESTRRRAYVRSYDAWRRAAATAIQFPHAEDELFGIADRIDLFHWFLPLPGIIGSMSPALAIGRETGREPQQRRGRSSR